MSYSCHQSYCADEQRLILNMVVPGDTTANLWWRMQNGELPRNHQPKLAVVMIGANDLTAAYVQCGTWDSNSYYNAAASIAQQCAPYVPTSPVCFGIAVLGPAITSNTAALLE